MREVGEELLKAIYVADRDGDFRQWYGAWLDRGYRLRTLGTRETDCDGCRL